MTIDGWSGEEINFKEVISPQNYQSFLLLLKSNSKHIFSLLIYFQIGVIFCEKTTLLSFETVQICQKKRPKWPGLAPIAAALRPKMLKFFLLFLLSRDLSARMPWNRVVGRAWSLLFFPVWTLPFLLASSCLRSWIFMREKPRTIYPLRQWARPKVLAVRWIHL